MRSKEEKNTHIHPCNFDDNVTLDDDGWKRGPSRAQQRAQRERTDLRRPKALERRRVLALRVGQDIQTQRPSSLTRVVDSSGSSTTSQWS
jgi:hypothetical protein